VLPLVGIGAVALDVGLAALLLGDPTSVGPAPFVGLAILAGASPILGRHRARRVSLVLGEGRVWVRRAGFLCQTIDARSITAASSTGTAGGVSMALARRDRPDHPILLEVETEAEADAIRNALGIGHFGFGSLVFRAKALPRDRTLMGLRVLAALGAIGDAAVRVLRPEEPLGPLLVPLVGIVLVAVLALRERFERVSEGLLAIDERGVHYGRESFVETIPFSDIEWAADTPEGLVVGRRHGRSAFLPVDFVRHGLTGMTHAELAHFAAQVQAAARRARGEMAPVPELAGQALARRGAEPRAWIAHLDATARAMTERSGYRATGATPAELWSVLENPDAPADLRAGAARVLVRADAGSRPRIELTLARVREAPIERRIRVMLDDDDDRTTRELAALDHAPQPRVLRA
jgi:hypothetical protein